MQIFMLFTETADSVIESPCLSVCLSVCAIGYNFFRGLSLDLRSHYQFPGLSLVPLPPSLPLGNLETWKLGNLETQKLCNSKTPHPKKKKKKKIMLTQKIQFLSFLVSVLLFALVERYSVSRMRDFLYGTCIEKIYNFKMSQTKISSYADICDFFKNSFLLQQALIYAYADIFAFLLLLWQKHKILHMQIYFCFFVK